MTKMSMPAIDHCFKNVINKYQQELECGRSTMTNLISYKDFIRLEQYYELHSIYADFS